MAHRKRRWKRARVIVQEGDLPFQLTDDIWMERFDNELGKKIQVA
jgi:hypothetical protein